MSKPLCEAASWLAYTSLAQRLIVQAAVLAHCWPDSKGIIERNDSDWERFTSLRLTAIKEGIETAIESGYLRRMGINPKTRAKIFSLDVALIVRLGQERKGLFEASGKSKKAPELGQIKAKSNASEKPPHGYSKADEKPLSDHC